MTTFAVTKEAGAACSITQAGGRMGKLIVGSNAKNSVSSPNGSASTGFELVSVTCCVVPVISVARLFLPVVWICTALLAQPLNLFADVRCNADGLIVGQRCLTLLMH